MLKWRISSGMLVLAGMLVEQGCWFRKAPPKASIVIPPAPQVQPPQPLATPPQLPPGELKAVDRTATMPTLPPPAVQPKPVKPRPVRRPQTPTTGVDAAPPIVNEPQSVSPPVLLPNPQPSLQPILGTKEIEERSRRIRRYLEKARLLVLRAERSGPDENQKQLIGQVRTFLQQAEDARKVDLVRAENLAERAEVLSRGLAR